MMGRPPSFLHLLISLYCIGCVPVMGADWSYIGSNGPQYWKNTHPICGQIRQSPINIYEGDVTQPGTLGAFSLDNYNEQADVQWKLKNNGHSAVVEVGGTRSITASGGRLGSTYKVAQFHFHWGSKSDRGSEHLISSHEYPMELHIVHYNTNYDNISIAAVKDDGLAVLGFMFEESQTNNAVYDGIANALEQVKDPGSQVPIIAQPLQNLFNGVNTAEYYRYSGSLTTPACYQSVTWTVFKEPIKISAAQLEKFRLIQDSAGFPLVNNYRPPQPINGREVEASFKPDLHWGYLDNDAAHWQDYYQSCGGDKQSPISIPSTSSQLDTKIAPFQFNGYDTSENKIMKLVNNGHTVNVAYGVGTISPAVSGGGLPNETYHAAQFHFHWGSTSSMGSEHKIDNAAYPMELHIVHFRSSLGSVGKAMKQADGLAVLGFFFEVSPNDNPALKPIVDALENVKEPGTSFNMSTAISLDSFLPQSRTDFYRYSGSLTTPGCYESVIWTVFNHHIMISKAQLDAFRRLKSSEKVDTVYQPMVDNFRPVQQLNSRVIRRTFTIVPPTWSYEGSDGVNSWSRNFPTCGNTVGASEQSPINIVPTEVQYLSMENIQFSRYNTPVRLELSNNGHTVQASIVQSGDLRISGGGLSDTYIAAQFHFHWGSRSDRGSEHLIDSKAYPMELHIVHYSSRYSALGTAATQPNGLAVLGFMFEVDATDNPALNTVVDNLDRIKNPKTKYMLTSDVAINTMIPSSLGDFYRYSGSLTTPGCYESVAWTVFRNTIKISERQLAKFRSVLSSEKDAQNQYKPLENNFRPPQPINSRIVRANFKIGAGSAVGMKSSVTALVFSLILAVWLKV